MGSRVLIGAGAWLLGAASATAGSLYAIAQLGNGLVEHTTQEPVRMVNAELAQDRAIPLSASPVSKPSSAASPKAPAAPTARRSAGKHHATPAVTYHHKWLWSEGGTAEALCSADGAQLRYISPAQGYEYQDVVLGPTAVAMVTFTNSSIRVVIKVTCDSAGVPAAQVSGFQLGGGGWHHDE